MMINIFFAFGLLYYMLEQNALLYHEVNVKRGTICPKDSTDAWLEVKINGKDCLKDY